MPSAEPGTWIVALRSYEGGVGKTTVALSMAYEWLANRKADKPVVLLDADLHGTEVADLVVPPYSVREPGRWSLGVLDILTQASAGNRGFEGAAKRHVEKIHDGSYELPKWTPEGAASSLIVIPTFRERAPADRARRVREGDLALRFATDSFGISQIKRRSEEFLMCLCAELQPSLILIDNSPFHLGIGEAFSAVMAEVPGADGEWRFGQDEAEVAKVREVHVVGPDLQELGMALDDLRRLSEGKGRNTAAQRWVLNRDRHTVPKGTVKEVCGSADTMEGVDNELFREAPSLVRKPEVLHFPHTPVLASARFNYVWSSAASAELAPDDAVGLVPEGEDARPVTDGVLRPDTVPATPLKEPASNLNEANIFQRVTALQRPGDPAGPGAARGRATVWDEGDKRWCYTNFHDFLA